MQLPPFLKNKWLQSFVIVIILFLLVNIFLHPLFNSGDDIFLMYTLSGGFSEAPSNLLHYDHIWHPILGWIVKTLFINFPTVNWYTLLLTAFHVFGCATIFYVLLKRFRWIIAFVLFMILFVFFEMMNLISLNFTATSWILAASGYFLLLHQLLKERRAINFFILFFLLLVAGLLRLHILFLVTILFLPAFILYSSKKYKIWIPVVLSICTVVFLLNFYHRSFYQNNIQNWPAEENRRQILFYAYNRPLNADKPVSEVFGDSITRAFYFNYFFFDSTLLSNEKFKTIVHSLTRKRDFAAEDDTQVLYWTFMESRVYILLFLLVFFFSRKLNIFKSILLKWSITSMLVFGVYGYLFLFFKITTPIYFGSLLLLWLFFCLAIPDKETQNIFKDKSFGYITLLLILPFSWMIVKIVKKENESIKWHQHFKCEVNELKNNTDKLFIATDDLPLNHFYIWDSPLRYKVPNLIYKDRIINNCYYPTLKLYGITDIMRSIYQNDKVFLLGGYFSELKAYYKSKKGIAINISPKLSGYKCLEVRKVSLVE